jgi:dTMP kinase
MSKLIVIEGTDGSGKNTQARKLAEKLKSEGFNIRMISYPNYESESSLFVKKYLGGEYGKKATDVDPHVASMFYALDRFDSHKIDFEGFVDGKYDDNLIVISDRYVQSNMIHQAGKFEFGNNRAMSKRNEVLNWVSDLEFNFMKLPYPDLVLFLDVPINITKKLRDERVSTIKNDIHENDEKYLENVYKNAKDICGIYKWTSLTCVDDKGIMFVDSIHENIYNEVAKIL